MVTVDEVRAAVLAGDLEAVREYAFGQRLMLTARGGGVTSDLSVMAMRALAVDDNGSAPTPAKRERQLACLRYLMSVYPVPDLDSIGRSALQSAAASGCFDVVYEVAKLYPDVPLGRHEHNPFFEALATSKCSPATVEYIFEHANMTLKHGIKAERDVLNAMLLQFSIVHSNVTLVRWLVDSGVDVSKPVPVADHFRFRFSSEPTGRGEVQRGYPVHFATSAPMVELLESLGAQLDPEDRSINGGEGALFAAVRAQMPAHVKYLLARGVRVDYANHLGETVLHCAADHGSYKDIEALVAAGAAVDAKDNKGLTPLMSSLRCGQNAARYKALINAGADVFARDADGSHRLLVLTETPVIEAAVKRILQSAEQGLAVDRAAMSDLACHLVGKRMTKLALELIECKAFDVGLTGAIGSTPVHEAAKVFKKGGQDASAFTAIISVALGKGFDLEMRNRRDFTPLMEAVSSKNLMAAQRLIELGAQANARTPTKVAGVERNSMRHLTRNPQMLGLLCSHETAVSIEAGVLAGGAGFDEAHGANNRGGQKHSLGML
jgi:ankyrin repeat protein